MSKKQPTVFVEGKTLGELSKTSGLKFETLYARYRRGDRTIEEITRPFHTGTGMGVKEKFSMADAGERFHRVLNDKNISITLMAKRTGISRTTIYEFCYNGIDISCGRLMKLCADVGVSTDYILTGRGVL